MQNDKYRRLYCLLFGHFVQFGGFASNTSCNIWGVRHFPKPHFVGWPTDSILSVVVLVLKANFLFRCCAASGLLTVSYHKRLICCGYFSSECTSNTGKKRRLRRNLFDCWLMLLISSTRQSNNFKHFLFHECSFWLCDCTLATHSSLYIPTANPTFVFITLPPVLYCWPKCLNSWTYYIFTCVNFSSCLRCIHTHAFYSENVALCVSSTFCYLLIHPYIKDALGKNVCQSNELHNVRQENTAIHAN